MPQPPRRRSAQADAPQQQQQQPTVLAAGTREGNRWIGNPPTPDDLAAWFSDSVRIHDGLDHKHYVGGIVLIPGKEKVERVNAQGNIFEQHRLSHTPYVKVDTRISYWWDWIEERFDGDVLGRIVPIRPAGGAPQGLPPGFFRYSAARGNEVWNFVGMSMRAEVVERSMRTGVEGKLVFEGPPATKLIATIDRYNKPDPFATMKAETGAIGRALGMAGMLIIPGSGVVTAEDMQEIPTSMPGAGTVEGDVQGAIAVREEADEDVADAGDIRAKIAELATRLESEAPGKFEEFEAWRAERKIPEVDKLKEHHLRGVLRQLERRLSEVEA